MEPTAAETDEPLKRVLSVQSSVVSGYVGNRAAMLPLQLLGFDVDCVNSVQFSNHTGYPIFKGTVLKGEELMALTEGLCANSLQQYDYLLTGYIGSQTFLEEVLTLLDVIEEATPTARYVCDPVLGDAGAYYVPQALVEVFKARVIPRAYMVTPNQFELSALTGMTIGSEHDLVSAMKTLIRMGPKIVVVTSSEVSDFPGYLSCYAMVMSSDDDTSVEISRVVISKIQGSSFTGTGDLSAALLLGWTDILERSTPEQRLRPSELGIALRNTLESVQAALRRTVVKTARMLKAGPVVASEHQHRAYRVKAAELSLVESRFDIMTPPRALPSLESSNGDVVSQWKASLEE